MNQTINDRVLAVNFARAAEMISLSTKTLRRFADDGRLRTVRAGRRRLIPMSSLLDLLQERNQFEKMP